MGEPGDTLTLTQTGGSGTLSLQQVSGVNEVIYTQPASIVASTTDAVSCTVRDQHNDAVASGSATVTLDAGPTLASTPPSKIGHGQTVTVGTVTPGLIGDTETLELLTAPNYGTLALASGTVTYTAPSTVPTTGETDSFRYEIVDQHDDAAAIGSATVALDPGPALASAPPTKVGYGQTAVIGTVTAGLAGDAETLKVLTAPTYGTLVLNNGTISYKAPPTVPTGETNHFSYEITDQLGDISAVATDAITLDPGPSAATAKISVKFGNTTDLTGAILAAVTPGLAGDSETITAIGSTSPNGSETLTSGDASFAASGGSLQHIPANGTATVSFAYTVTDQLNETSSSTVQVTVGNPADNIYGSTNGNATIQGTPGADVITAYAYNNTIYDNGGNDLVYAGSGQATIYTSSGDVIVHLSGQNNAVSGGDGYDTVSGSQGNTTLTLGNGNDTITLGGSGNTVTLGNGTDVVSGSTGNTTINVGSGNDTLSAGGNNNMIIAVLCSNCHLCRVRDEVFAAYPLGHWCSQERVDGRAACYGRAAKQAVGTRGVDEPPGAAVGAASWQPGAPGCDHSASLTQASGRNRRKPTGMGTSPRARVSDTSAWQFARLPNWPQYCRATPTECRPCLTSAVSSTTSTASGPPTRRSACSASTRSKRSCGQGEADTKWCSPCTCPGHTRPAPVSFADISPRDRLWRSAPRSCARPAAAAHAHTAAPSAAAQPVAAPPGTAKATRPTAQSKRLLRHQPSLPHRRSSQANLMVTNNMAE